MQKNRLGFFSPRQIGLLVSVSTSIVLMAAACSGSGSATPTATPTAAIVESSSAPTATSTPGGAQNSDTSQSSLAQDVCSILKTSDVEAALGQTVVVTTPGADEDTFTGHPINFCTYMGSGKAIVLSVVNSGGGSSEAETMLQQLINLQNEDSAPTIEKLNDFGGTAYFATTEKAAGVDFVKDGWVIGVALGGAVGDPVSHKDAMITLAKTIQ